VLKNINKNKILVKEFIWVLIGNIVNTLGLLIITKIFSFYLPQASFGLYYLGTTLTIFATQIFFGPFGNGFSRFYWIASEENELSVFFKESLNTIKYFSLLFLSISLILYYSTKNMFQINFPMFICFILIAISSSFSSLIYSYYNIIRKRKTVAIYQIIDIVIKVSLLFFVAVNHESSILKFLIIIATSNLFILFLQILNLRRSIFLKIDYQSMRKKNVWARRILIFSYPFTIWGIFTWFQMSSDRYFLGYFISATKVAEYAIVFQLGYYPPSILIGNFVQTVTPILYQKVGSANNHENVSRSSNLINKMAFYSILLVILGSILMLFFSKIIIDLLAHEKYIEVSNYLPYMFLSGGVFSTAQIISIDFQSKMRMKALMWIKITTALIGIIFSFIFIKYFDFIGAVFSSIFFSTIYLLSLYYFSKKNTSLWGTSI